MERQDDASLHSALASPVRQRLLGALEGAAAPATAQDLAASVALHVTTVRFHLDHLVQAGLVARATEHAPRRGRPSVVYRAVGLNAALASEQMIDALASALAAGHTSTDEVMAAGRRWAEALATDATVDTRDRYTADGTGAAGATILAPFSRLGFDPELEGDTIRLRACPFRDAARRNPEVVCLLHLGLARGLAERVGDVRVALQPFAEPDLCLITLKAG